MSKFLTTSATNYFLEELIKTTKERLILISPYWQLCTRIRELLQDTNTLKIDTRIVYGKKDLSDIEKQWLSKQQYIRTTFCENLHAKCYLNENCCIITSLNLYEFSQVNNNEMGVLIQRAEEPETYRQILEEAQRLIRIGKDIFEPATITAKPAPAQKPREEKEYDKLTTGKLADKLGITTDELFAKLTKAGYLSGPDDKRILTDKGKQAGGEFRKNYGNIFFLWPKDITTAQLAAVQQTDAPIKKAKTLRELYQEQQTKTQGGQ
jgi:hypothetical protein